MIYNTIEKIDMWQTLEIISTCKKINDEMTSMYSVTLARSWHEMDVLISRVTWTMVESGGLRPGLRPYYMYILLPRKTIETHTDLQIKEINCTLVNIHTYVHAWIVIYIYTRNLCWFHRRWSRKNVEYLSARYMLVVYIFYCNCHYMYYTILILM